VAVQTPEPYPEAQEPRSPRIAGRADELVRRGGGMWTLGERLTWVSGLVLALSAFTGWYAGTGDFTLSVIGWHTGILGKAVFFIGLAVVAIAALRLAGIELPATVPESLLTIGLGTLSTIFVLIRLIDVPEEFLPAASRGIGIWIALAASLGVIVAGLMQASEEL
jgi:hypothetical protein